MTNTRDEAAEFLKKYDHDRGYGLRGMEHMLPEAALLVRALLDEKKPKAGIRDVFPISEGWELEQDVEGGQPNGVGTIEPNDAREWFYTENETHHRTRIVLYGPWQAGPTPDEAERRKKVAQHKARLAEEKAREQEKNRPSEEEKILKQAEEILARRAAEHGS